MFRKKTQVVWNARTLAILGMMIALTIVLTRVLSINIGGAVRLSAGHVCTILTGLWFGPAAGGAAGAIADMLGLLLAPSGTWMPLITIGAALWGIIPGFLAGTVCGSARQKTLRLSMIVVLTSVICQLGVTLAGLVILYGWGIIPGRLIQFAGSTPLYCVLVSLLYASPVTGMVREQTQLKEAAK